MMSVPTKNQIINIHHHLHHHFNDKMITSTTSTSELPGSNPVTSQSRRYQPTVFLPFSSISQITVEKNRNLQTQNFYGKPSNIIQCLKKNKHLLEQCGFYYGDINSSKSTELLRKTSKGTFLVRDSSDSRFMYTLSVQRNLEEGPTSVRIHFAEGKFHLDADDNIKKFMPTFDSILDLVKHYCSLSKSDFAKSHHWIDNKTRNVYPSIFLGKPLLKNVCWLDLNLQTKLPTF
jgi:hypothetical protein